MKRLVLLAALCAFGCGCGSTKKAAGPSCDELRPMVDRLYSIEAAQLAGGMSPRDQQRVVEIGAKVGPAMKDAIVGACRADAWAPDVIACMSAARGEAALDDCESRLSPAARARVEAAMSEIVTRIEPPDSPAEDDSLGVGESGVPECDAYATAMEAYLDCDAIAEPVKTSAKNGLAQLRRTWPLLKDPSTPASARQAAAAACVEARTELEDSAKAQGCGADHPPADCAVLGPMIKAILGEQLRGVPADRRAAAEAQAHALAAPLEQSLVATCTAGRWSASATACFGAAHSAQALVACEAQLTPDQAHALAQAMEQVTALIAGGPAAPAPVRITACDDYLAAVNALVACDKLPADDRARMQRSSALVIDGLRRLADASLPAAKDIATTCASALAATKTLAAKLGC